MCASLSRAWKVFRGDEPTWKEVIKNKEAKKFAMHSVGLAVARMDPNLNLT